MNHAESAECSMSPRLTFLDCDRCTVEGCISFDTTLGIQQEFVHKLEQITASTSLPSNFEIRIDLKALEAVDASALALFIGWVREAHIRKVKLSFYHAPQSLVKMARISRLDYLFLNSSY